MKRLLPQDEKPVKRASIESNSPSVGYTDDPIAEECHMTVFPPEKDAISTPEPQNPPLLAVTPFLTKHISESSLIPNDTYHRYCYRHNPQVLRNKLLDNLKMASIQSKLELLPIEDRNAIAHCWSIFSAAPAHQRRLILQGLLSQCCFPTLSFVNSEVNSLIRIDFILNLPIEISLKILCYLDCASLCNAAQVCRKWKVLADDDRVWHHMCEQHIDRKCPSCGWGLPLMHMKRYAAPGSNNVGSRSGSANSGAGVANSRPASTESRPASTDSHPANTESRSGSASIVNVPTPSSEADSNKSSSQSKSEKSKKSEDPEKPEKLVVRRPWKSVYSERYTLEKNWRKGIYNVKSFIGHTDGITCLQFNQKHIITGSYDSTIKIWDIQTQKCVRTLVGHTKGIRSLIFDNQKLISCGLDTTIKVWNYHTGQCISTYRGHEDAVVSVDFHDKTIVSGSADATVKVWHVDSRTCYTLRGHNDWVNCVKIHPQSNTVFSASDDTTIKMWDLETHQCIKTFEGETGHVGQVQCVIPINYKDSIIGDHDEIHETEITNYPTHLISSSLDNTIKIWDVKTGKCIRTQFGHIEGVWSISADNFRIVSGAHDRLIKVWDLQNGKCLHTWCGESSVSCVALSDNQFAAGLENGVVKLYCFDVK